MTAYSAVTKGTSRDLGRVLQNTGIEINAPLTYRARTMTLLHIAVDTGEILKVRLLLAQGPDIEAQDQDGDTALVYAIRSRRQDIVELLLRYGAKTSITAWISSFSIHVPLLHFACKSGCLETVQTLLKCGDTVGLNHHEIERKYTPLHLAVYNSDEKILQTLLEEGADPKAHDHISATPLHFAAGKKGKATLASLLLRYNADIDAENIHGRTPLIYAVSAANEDVMDLLLENGAQIMPPTKDFRDTAIHMACKGPNKMLLLRLMTGNEYLHVRGDIGHYPIRTAARWASKWAVEYLLDIGANFESVDRDGATLLHLAAKNRNGGEDLVAFLLSWGADINAKDSVEDTPLHDAARKANEGAATLLIQHTDRDKIDANNVDGNTALHLACAAGSVVIVEELLKKGADITERTISRRTPLHLAAKSGSFETVKFLLEHGANINARTMGLSRAVDLARKEGHMSCVRLLEGWV